MPTNRETDEQLAHNRDQQQPTAGEVDRELAQREAIRAEGRKAPPLDLPQDEAVVVIERNDVTLGGEVRHAGARFYATDLPEGVYAYVLRGKVFGARIESIEKGEPLLKAVVQPPITMGYRLDGSPILLESEERVVEEIDAEPRIGRFSMDGAATNADVAASERLGLSRPVAGAAALLAQVQAVAQQQGAILVDDTQHRDNYLTAIDSKAAVDANIERQTYGEDQEQAQAEREAALNRQRLAHGTPLEDSSLEQLPPFNSQPASEKTALPPRGEQAEGGKAPAPRGK